MAEKLTALVGSAESRRLLPLHAASALIDGQNMRPSLEG